MPLLLALIGIAITAYVWFNRAQRVSHVAGDLINVAADVRNAARRFGFRKRANRHPVEGIDDPKLVIGAMATAFLELDDLPNAEARSLTDLSLRKHLNLDAATAQEITVLGRWFVEECKGPVPAFPRLAKKLKVIDGAASFETLMAVLKDVAEAGGGAPSARQSDALTELARIFRLQ